MGPNRPEFFTMVDIMAELRQLRARAITKDLGHGSSLPSRTCRIDI